MLWRCQDCAGCDLCSLCYSDDKHDQRHLFLRIDIPGSDGYPVPKRKTSVKTRAIGLFPGSKVTRGKDWQWDDQDGGQGSEGKVKGYENVSPDSSRNLVRVQWSHGGANSYRLGFHGKVDLLCIEEELGPFYYRDHLPVLDTTKVFQPEALIADAVSHTTHSDVSSTGATAVSSTSTGHSDKNSSLEANGTVKDTATSTPSLDKSATDSARDEGCQDYSDQNRRKKDSGTITYGGESIHYSSDDDGGKQMQRLSKFPDSALSSSEDKLDGGEGTNVMREECFVSGDKVAIKVSESVLMELQENCGCSTEGITKVIGYTGEVTQVSVNGTVSANFKSTVCKLNPRALTEVRTLTEGSNVRIRNNMEEVKVLNRRIGWKEEMQHTIGKVGRVLKLDRDGDALISFGRHVFLFAPACCIPAPDVKPDSLKIEVDGKPPRTTAKTISNEKQISLTKSTVSTTVKNENQGLYQKLREAIQNESRSTRTRGSISDLYTAIKCGDHAAVREMCMADRSLLEREYHGVTPLMMGCIDGTRCLQVVRTLLDLGADPNHGILPSKTPLYACLQGECEDMVELLLQTGADPLAIDEKFRSYIHYATLFNMPGSIWALAAAGVDVNIKDDDKHTALHLAVEKCKDEAVAALVQVESIDFRVQNGHEFDALHLACLRGNARAVELIAERDKAGVNRWHNKGNTPLHTAAINDHDECIRLLILLGGANTNLPDRLGGSYTPLHQACNRARVKAVEALLEFGADVNLQTVKGDTPLHMITARTVADDMQSHRGRQECERRVAIASMLITKGAYVDVENRGGLDPMTCGSQPVVEGIRRFMKDNEGLVKRKGRGIRFEAGIKSTAFSEMFIASLPQSQGHCQLKEALKGMGLPCGLCGTSKSDVTLQPCQHKCVCSACSVKVTTCPLCDEEVKDKVVTKPDEQTLDLDALKKLRHEN